MYIVYIHKQYIQYLFIHCIFAYKVYALHSQIRAAEKYFFYLITWCDDYSCNKKASNIARLF